MDGLMGVPDFPAGSIRAFHFEDLWLGRALLLQGLGLTVLMAALSIVAGFVLGTGLGILREEAPVWLRRPAALYIEFIRSIPLILFMVFIHYGVMFWVNSALNRNASFLESSIVALTLFGAAYFAEIIRGGFRAIKQTERDAAKSLGLSYPQRLLSVFLPLAYSRTVPALIGQCITLIKDTSLASIIGVHELTRQGEILFQNTFHDFEVLVFLAGVYFALCFTLSRLSRRFEFGARASKLLNVTVLEG